MLKIPVSIVPLVLLGAVQASAQGGLPVEVLASDLYRIESTVGSNILALRGSEFTLLVDAGPWDGVERLQATLDSLSMPPVKYVILTIMMTTLPATPGLRVVERRSFPNRQPFRRR